MPEIKIIYETWSKVDESAKISGIAAIPRISRNNRLYLKSELEKVDKKKVPLNWEHTDRIIGEVTFHYEPTLEQLTYDGVITDSQIAQEAKTKTMHTSIQASATEVRSQCFTNSDCMDIPMGLYDWQLALTSSPGIPETSVGVYEKFVGYEHKCIEHIEPSNTATVTVTTENTDAEINSLKSELLELRTKLDKATTCKNCGKHKSFS